MKHEAADNFFDNVDYVSIIDTVKGIYTSDGSMNTLLDFERVLDESDLYAYRNWELGELVQGPTVNRYSVSCVFMWPYKLMPNPKGSKRLVTVGCTVKFVKTTIEVPVEVKDYENYIKEGTIDLAGQTIDLEELDDSYDEDLDKDSGENEEESSDLNMDPQNMPPGSPPAVPGVPAM